LLQIGVLIVEAMRTIISIFILMMYMHILYPFDQLSECQTFDSADTCNTAGFQFLFISHHPCKWIELPNNIQRPNCISEPSMSLTSMLIAAFISSVLSTLVAIVLNPLFKLLCLYRHEFSNSLPSSSSFFAIVPSSNTNSTNSRQQMKLILNSSIYTESIPASKLAIDHLRKILHRVCISQYGRIDRDMLTRNSAISNPAFVKTFLSDFSEFLLHVGTSSFSDELKSAWGVRNPTRKVMPFFKNNVVVPDLPLDNNQSIDISTMPDIAREMYAANANASKTFFSSRLLNEEDKRHILMNMFVADIIGQNTAEGKLFTAITAPIMVI
jgi:hypothetical protein